MVNYQGDYDLHVVLENGDVTRHASVDVQDNLGRTALLGASENGHATCVELLLGAGASVDVQDNLGKTALHEASRNGCKSCVEQLLRTRDITVDTENYRGMTARHVASEMGHAACVALLLHAGASMDQTDNIGRTPVYLAIETLVMRADARRTPLYLAMEKLQLGEDGKGGSASFEAPGRSQSARLKTSQEKGFKNRVQEKEVMKLRRKSQDAKNKHGLNVMGRAGEADKHYVDKMQKTRYMQKTRDYR